MPTPLEPEQSPARDLPHIFVDRSLGSIQVPRLLRAEGFQLTTMAEHYGEQQAQSLDDQAWIAETARLGWIAFHKDDAIRRNEAEKNAVRRSGARCFCVPRADLTAPQAVRRYLDNLAAIARAVGASGPFIYSVYPDGIRQIPLD